MTAAKITKKRDVNLDLLRIVSMLLIVFLHSIDHSGVLEAAEAAPKAMYFYVRFTYALCQVCVNCYVLLSGYYLVCARFQLQKLAALWMETVFYALLFKGLFMALGTVPFSPVSLVGCFFPILTGRYWFLTIYVGMYLVFPFLNLLVGAMDRRQHTLLNFCLFCLFSLWNSIHPAIAGMNSGGGWGLAWFVVLYLAAAWFRLYYTPSGRPTFAFAAFFLLPLLMAAAQMAAELTGIGILQTVLKNWFRYDSAPVFLMTLCLFTAFLRKGVPLHLRRRAADAGYLSDSQPRQCVSVAVGDAGAAGEDGLRVLPGHPGRLRAGNLCRLPGTGCDSEIHGGQAGAVHTGYGFVRQSYPRSR